MAFVYLLQDPRDKTIRYVGVTNNPKRRLSQHKTSPANKKLKTWIDSLKSQNIEPDMLIIDEAKREDALEIEANMIWLFSKLSKKLLCNGGGTRVAYRFHLSKNFSHTVRYAKCKACGELHNLVDGNDAPKKLFAHALENPVTGESIYICAKCGKIDSFALVEIDMDWQDWWSA